jgi:hypothetical protein
MATITSKDAKVLAISTGCMYSEKKLTSAFRLSHFAILAATFK